VSAKYVTFAEASIDEFLGWITAALILIQTRIGSCGPFKLPWKYTKDADNTEPSDKYALVLPQVLM